MSVGGTIRAAREASGLTLDEVAHATKLRATIPGAMEQDDFSHCGGSGYARGQLRTIAPVVGLDADALVELFVAQLGVDRE